MRRSIVPSSKCYAIVPKQHQSPVSAPRQISTLMNFIAMQNWYEAIRRCDSHPHETTVVDGWGNTALHIASHFLNVPPNAIQKLLVNISPDAQNKEGVTPLHIACSLGCSDEVIQSLLEASKLDFLSSIQHHDDGPEVSIGNSILTKSGKTLLHYACGSHRGPSTDAFRSLVEYSVASGTVLWEDDAGNNALHVLHNRYSERIQKFLYHFGHKAATRIDSGETYLEIWLGEYWERTTLIAKAAYYGTTTDDQHHRMLHACVGIGSSCPNTVVKLAMRAHEEQVFECDQHGNYPLHLAASHISASKGCANDDHFDVVGHLVDKYPEAAQLRNKQGHLPLSLAWNMGRFKWGSEVKYILDAYPNALEYLDITDHRVSLILSLLGKCSDDEELVGINSISLIYQLLKQRPALMHIE